MPVAAFAGRVGLIDKEWYVGSGRLRLAAACATGCELDLRTGWAVYACCVRVWWLKECAAAGLEWMRGWEVAGLLGRTLSDWLKIRSPATENEPMINTRINQTMTATKMGTTCNKVWRSMTALPNVW